MVEANVFVPNSRGFAFQRNTMVNILKDFTLSRQLNSNVLNTHTELCEIRNSDLPFKDTTDVKRTEPMLVATSQNPDSVANKSFDQV